MQYIKIRSHVVHLSRTGPHIEQNIVSDYHVCGFFFTSRQHCQIKRYPDSPMRMADSRSLLASLTGFDSPLPPSLCPARCEGAAGGGRSGGGGPGGGGTMRGPGGGTGGSGMPWPTCKTPLCGAGGNAPGGKPKAVWADGMGGPGV